MSLRNRSNIDIDGDVVETAKQESSHGDLEDNPSSEACKFPGRFEMRGDEVVGGESPTTPRVASEWVGRQDPTTACIRPGLARRRPSSAHTGASRLVIDPGISNLPARAHSQKSADRTPVRARTCRRRCGEVAGSLLFLQTGLRRVLLLAIPFSHYFSSHALDFH